MKETIFFATFNTVGITHVHDSDRSEYFQSEKTLKDFHDWLQKNRKNIEFITDGDTIITSMQFIKSGY